MNESIAISDLMQVILQRADSLSMYWNILIGVSTVIVWLLALGKSFRSVKTKKFFLRDCS